MGVSLADRYAAAKAAADAALEALDALKAEIKALGKEKIEGVTCDVFLVLSEQRRVDQKLIPAEILEACKRPVLVETIRVKARGI